MNGNVSGKGAAASVHKKSINEKFCQKNTNIDVKQTIAIFTYKDNLTN